MTARQELMLACVSGFQGRRQQMANLVAKRVKGARVNIRDEAMLRCSAFGRRRG